MRQRADFEDISGEATRGLDRRVLPAYKGSNPISRIGIDPDALLRVGRGDDSLSALLYGSVRSPGEREVAVRP